MTGYSAVLPHFDNSSLIVISGGEAYVVDPDERHLLGTFGGDIEWAFTGPTANLLLIGNGIRFEAWDKRGLRWRTRRIFWDGMRDARIEEGKVKGEAWSPIDDLYYPFAVDLEKGTVEGAVLQRTTRLMGVRGYAGVVSAPSDADPTRATYLAKTPER